MIYYKISELFENKLENLTRYSLVVLSVHRLDFRFLTFTTRTSGQGRSCFSQNRSRKGELLLVPESPSQVTPSSSERHFFPAVISTSLKEVSNKVCNVTLLLPFPPKNFKSKICNIVTALFPSPKAGEHEN